MRTTLTLLIALFLAAGCGGDPSGPQAVKAILINPGVALLSQAGATQQFAATAVDAAGSTVTGVSVKWKSSNTAVVKIDAATGIATAIAKGNATIFAEAGSASGSASVTVHLPVCTQPTNVTLAVGQTLVTDIPTSATCAVRLPAGAIGDRYRVAIVRLATAQDATAATATLKLSGGVATAPIPTPPAPLPLVIDAEEEAILEDAARTADATAAAHARLREAEDALLARLGPLQATVYPSIILGPTGPRAVAPAKKTFLPRTSSDGSCSLSGKVSVTGLLVAQNASMAIYQDSAQMQTNPASGANVGRMLDFYDQYGKETITQYFGAVPDRDGNGQVTVFITSTLTPSNNVAAFVWGGDQLDANVCAASNQMELVYFNLVIVNQSASNSQALETLVHEVKHVVSFNHRMSGSSFNSHPTWLEEGTAEIAGEIASRKAWFDKGGPAPNDMVKGADLAKSTPENVGVRLRVMRTRDYLSAKTNSLVYGGDSSSIYGSGWHFSRFLGDGYGNEATQPGGAASFFTAQNAAATPAGLLGLQTVTGTPFDVLLTEFAAAIMLNGMPGVPPPHHGFTTYDFQDAAQPVDGVRYPYPVTPSPSAGFVDGSWTGTIGNAGLRIHDFTNNTGKAAEITAQIEEPAKLVVVRLR